MYPEAERYFVCPQCYLMRKPPGLCVSPQGWSEMSGWELRAEIHVMLAHMRCDAADTHACVGLRIASRWMGGCAAELKMKDTWDPPPPPHHISVCSLMWTGLRLRKRGRGQSARLDSGQNTRLSVLHLNRHIQANTAGCVWSCSLGIHLSLYNIIIKMYFIWNVINLNCSYLK